MLKRYGPITAAVMVAALVVSVLIYGVSKNEYQSTCQVAVSLPPTAVHGSDYFTANQRLTTTTILSSLGSGVYTKVSSQEGVDVASLRSETTVAASPNAATVAVQVTDGAPARAGRLANGICSATVTQARAYLEQQQTDAVSNIADRLAELTRQRDTAGAKPAAERTAADTTVLAADDAALKVLQANLAATLAVPPDQVEVVEQARDGIRTDSRSLTRNVLVALVGGVLVSFLIVLVGEVAAERRERAVR